MRSLFMILLVTSLSVQGQDPHFSQASCIPLYQNPSFTGLSGKSSAYINYRQQWTSASSPFISYAASGDYRFSEDDGSSALAVGALLMKQTSGDGKFQTLKRGLTVAGQIKTGTSTKLSLGMSYGFVNNAIQYNTLTWGSQYNGETYDARMNSGENLSRNTASYHDLGAGVSYILQNNSATPGLADFQWVIGYSIDHLNTPQLSIAGGNEELPHKHTIYLTGNSAVNDRVRLKPLLVVYRQAGMTELLMGTLASIYGRNGQKKESLSKSISFGVMLRLNDAVIPSVEAQYKKIGIGFSYDITLSDLKSGNTGRGGPEIMMRFRH